MRMPAIQHVYDSDQRTLILDFEQVDDETLVAKVPGKNIAIGGYYYLFINRSDGDTEVVEHDGDGDKGKGHRTPAKDLVPSVARILHVSGDSDDRKAPQPMGGGKFRHDGASPVEENTSCATCPTRWRRRHPGPGRQPGRRVIEGEPSDGPELDAAGAAPRGRHPVRAAERGPGPTRFADRPPSLR